MTVIVKNIIASKHIETSQTTQYTAPGGKAAIDSFTATNVSSSNATFSINIVTSGGIPSISNLLLDTKELAPNESYPCPEIVGQILESGDYISAIASASSAITIRSSGREIS